MSIWKILNVYKRNSLEKLHRLCEHYIMHLFIYETQIFGHYGDALWVHKFQIMHEEFYWKQRCNIDCEENVGAVQLVHFQ